MRLEPLRDLVLIRLRPLPEKTGLILRVSRQEFAGWADVVDTGPECVDVRKGDVVLVSVLAGQQVGEEILLPESSILAYQEAA